MNENEEKKELDLFLPGGYKAPESRDSIVDTQSGTVSEIKDMPPLEQIKMAAQRANVTINEKPKKNCKRCYERGYIAWNPDKSPVVCKCMFPPETAEQKKERKGQVPLSMLSKKVQRKYYREKSKQLRKEINSESTKRELRLLQEKLLKEESEKQSLSGTDVSGTVDSVVDSIVKPKNESEVVDGVDKG